LAVYSFKYAATPELDSLTIGKDDIMFTFIAVFMLIFAIANLYILRWLKPAFGWKRTASLVFVLFVVIMFALSILSHFFDRHGHLGLARVMGLIGHMWMLLIVWIVSFGLIAEIWNLLVLVISRSWPTVERVRLSPGRFVSGLGVLAALLCVWGIVEGNSLYLETIPITTPKLPEGTRPLRVLQISDLHLTSLGGQRQIDRIMRLAGKGKPDLVVCTGDLFDSAATEMTPLARHLAMLRAPLGKLAILGNHEYYVGLPQSMELLRTSGFLTLRDETVRLQCGKTGIVVAGVDDPTASMIGKASRTDEQSLLRFDFLKDFTILLKHQPIVSTRASGWFDLQLSGHTHGGQVFPFHFWVWLFYPHLSGLHDVGNAEKLYISNGVGTWGPPIRVLARPTVTIFEIRPASDAKSSSQD
jgi:predicted MPP superfamily phosphohydrolase